MRLPGGSQRFFGLWRVDEGVLEQRQGHGLAVGGRNDDLAWLAGAGDLKLVSVSRQAQFVNFLIEPSPNDRVGEGRSQPRRRPHLVQQLVVPEPRLADVDAVVN